MIKNILLLLFTTNTAFAGLPPTTSKVSTDANNVTTFNFQFPNFTGTHTGTTVSLGVNSIAGGGTGQATKAAAFNALSPMTTGGDLIYGGASGAGTRLANGSAGQYLTSGGGTAAPTWTTGLSNPLTTTGDIIYGVGSTPTRLAAGTSGYILQTLGNTLAPIWTALSSIAGSITSNSTSTLRMDVVDISTPCTVNGVCTLGFNAAPGFSISRTATGRYTATYTAYSSRPTCLISSINGIPSSSFVNTDTPTTTTVNIGTRNSGSVDTDISFSLMCYGPR